MVTGIMEKSPRVKKIEDLNQLASEIVRPTIHNQKYRSHLNRPDLAKLLKDLNQFLGNRGINYFSCDDLLAAVEQVYLDAKKRNKVGECYQIQTFGGPRYLFGSVVRDITVSPEAQQKIEELFSEHRLGHLSATEAKLLLEKRLTPEDLMELRAIRKASELFEQATPLKNDNAGGFFSNFKGELKGGDQLNCDQEAESHLQFLRTLSYKGLIKKFEVVGKTSQPPSLLRTGHLAVLLRSRATGQEVVYDSWFEKGGAAAHILLPEDWENLSFTFQNKFNDIVALEPAK